MAPFDWLTFERVWEAFEWATILSFLLGGLWGVYMGIAWPDDWRLLGINVPLWLGIFMLFGAVATTIMWHYRDTIYDGHYPP